MNRLRLKERYLKLCLYNGIVFDAFGSNPAEDIY